MKILFEDKHIIVCVKEPGMLSQSDRSMAPDMVNAIKNHIYEKEGTINPYVGLIHRLDRGVGGVMVFAKTPQAAKNLSSQMQKDSFCKKYRAVVTKDLSSESEEEAVVLENYLVKDGRSNLSRIVSKSEQGAKLAKLEYKVLGVTTDPTHQFPISLLDVRLYTGRHHQIRVQLSNAMNGIWGDTKYNQQFVKQRGWSNIALYAYSLMFAHPATNKRMEFEHLPEQIPFAYF
ncbi:similar to tRNA pseudouridine synthase C, group TruC1 [Lachnospiraceae bacterium KM106-2]|nr:similar to tRNA pseudouridine synthase C, group TruC1 [Lachnospiraceae bacterium KM106-2]